MVRSGCSGMKTIKTHSPKHHVFVIHFVIKMCNEKSLLWRVSSELFSNSFLHLHFFSHNFFARISGSKFFYSLLGALAPGNVKESDASKIKTHDDGGDDDHFINLLFCQPRCFIAHNKFKPWEDQENAWLHKSGSTILPMRVLPNFFVARRIP